MVLFIFKLGTIWTWVVNITLRPFHHRRQKPW